MQIDTLEEAQKALRGRVSTVAKRFREPGNTDEEFKKIQAKKRRSDKKDLKSSQAKAHSMNIQYLVEEMNVHTASVPQASEDLQALSEEDIPSVMPSTLSSPSTVSHLLLPLPGISSTPIEEDIVVPKLASPLAIVPILPSPSALCYPEKVSTTLPIDITSSTEASILSTPATIHHLSKNLHASVEVELSSIGSTPPANSDLLKDSELSSSPSKQQPSDMYELSFDLSSLDIQYVDLFNELIAEEAQIGQNMSEVI